MKGKDDLRSVIPQTTLQKFRQYISFMGKAVPVGIPKNRYTRPLIIKNHTIKVHNRKEIILLKSKIFHCIIQNSPKQNYDKDDYKEHSPQLIFITIKEDNLLNNRNTN